jgi:hypothetical protein
MRCTPDPMRHLIGVVLPKRMVDRIIAKHLGLMPSARRVFFSTAPRMPKS